MKFMLALAAFLTSSAMLVPTLAAEGGVARSAEAPLA